MAPGKRTASPVRKLIVRLYEEENYTFDQIGSHLQMNKGTVSRIYGRIRNPPIMKKRGRPRVTNER